jgi:signal transduction histidine kinase
VANVSHELRTPLTHIHGYLELLLSEALGELNDDQKKALDVSMRSSIRLQSLIDDLILFSLAARGEMTLVLKPVDLNSVIEAVLMRVGPKASEQQIDLRIQVDPALPRVQADQEKLSWVISQLLNNAIKFTKPNGKVGLTAKLENDKMINITVTDTGIGIASERIKEIFEPFHQLDGSATRRYGGTGLGLALVRQIIEAHGSVINVYSELNKGTTITFILLVAKSEGEAL